MPYPLKLALGFKPSLTALLISGAGLLLAWLAWAIYDAFRKLRSQIRRRSAELEHVRDELVRAQTRTNELAGSLSLLNTTFESASDGIVVVDLAGQIVSYNSRFAAIWHFPSGLLEQRKARDLRAYIAGQIKDGERFQARTAELQAMTEPAGCDVIELKDGRTFERCVSPHRWDGKCVGTVINWRDIGERKEAVDALADDRDLLRTLLDNSPDAIYFKDTQSRFIKSSRAQAAHFGLKSADELEGKTDFNFFAESHAQRAFEAEQKIIQTGEPITGLIARDVRKDGREIWLHTNKMPLRNKAGGIIGTLGISRDITAVKEAEAKLEQAHRQLIEASRHAGMAEVATGILHNVGNVLNSVSVSVRLVADLVRRSKAGNLGKVCLLFEQHKADLGGFLTSDPKGQIIPDYLRALAEDLAREQTAIVGEWENLHKNIEHIKDIVAMQQAHTRYSTYTEAVSLPDLVEDALRVNASSPARHATEIARDYQARPVATLDKHKAIQILVNLLSNAGHACDESGRIDKLITVRITAGEHWMRIAITDNGVGIPPENLTRIFNQGFTTRKDGHGFGLHNAALAAKELDGSLTVQSDGVGHGATFTLELPDKATTPAHDQPAV